MKKHLIQIIFLLSLSMGYTGNFAAGRSHVVAFLGDSNLWQGGDDCSGERAWSHWLYPDSEKVVLRSFARSGATITNTVSTPADTTAYTELLADYNTLYAQALRLKGAVERGEMPLPTTIYIYGGSNDAWFADRRPGLFEGRDSLVRRITSRSLPSEATTLKTSLKLVVEILRDMSPASEIRIVGPPFMTRVDRTAIHRVSAAMRDVAGTENIEFIPLDDDLIINPDEERARPRLTSDGVHTTADGARRIAAKINSLLRNQ